MKKPRIYIDTSIVGGCFDEEFASESRALLAKVERGEVVLLVSDLLLDELSRAPDNVQALIDGLRADCVEYVTTNEEAQTLRMAYLAANVVGKASKNDAHHVALATVYSADMIVSWNFRHIVHYDKIRNYNGVNIREGYGSIEIYSPKEVV